MILAVALLKGGHGYPALIRWVHCDNPWFWGVLVAGVAALLALTAVVRVELLRQAQEVKEDRQR